MKQIAIDIVLLPDEKAQEICKKVNQQIWWEEKKIDFIQTGKTPHISLIMGIMNEVDAEKIADVLSHISKNFSAIKLKGKIRKYIIQNTGEAWASFELEKSKQVSNLFIQISEKIKPYLDYNNISTNMFYMATEVEKQSCIWLEGFKNRTSEEYHSHITLWIGDTSNLPEQEISFTAETLAIYQLGNYCTCENKLFEIAL